MPIANQTCCAAMLQACNCNWLFGQQTKHDVLQSCKNAITVGFATGPRAYGQQRVLHSIHSVVHALSRLYPGFGTHIRVMGPGCLYVRIAKSSGLILIKSCPTESCPCFNSKSTDVVLPFQPAPLNTFPHSHTNKNHENK